MNERLNQFKNYINGKRVALLGMGISNRAAVDFLLSAGAVLSARDQNPNPNEEITEFLTSRGVKMIYGENYLSDITEDVVFKSPGIRFDIPALAEAAAKGTVITSEMEVFTAICPCKIFAVTGSDGKTTTTTLVSEMLKRAAARTGARVYLGGNIGTPLLPFVTEMEPSDFAVLELSSFQLHTMKTAPVSAIVTNITPNHLNWHLSMDEYIESKKNIYALQDASCRLTLNANNAVTLSMADESKAPVTFFSSTGEKPAAAHNCTFENGTIFYDGAPVMTRKDIKLVGMHNVENYMAAISAVWGFAEVSDMLDVARNFGGVAHRIELVCEKDGVKYYNSSIDTSPTRTLAALASFDEKLIVIVGGYDKHIPIEPLIAPLAEKAKFVVATGDTGLEVLQKLTAYGYDAQNVAYIGSFDGAVRFAMQTASDGDTVILSPAAASFDHFVNFEARGNRFRELVTTK